MLKKVRNIWKKINYLPYIFDSLIITLSCVYFNRFVICSRSNPSFQLSGHHTCADVPKMGRMRSPFPDLHRLRFCFGVDVPDRDLGNVEYAGPVTCQLVDRSSFRDFFVGGGNLVDVGSRSGFNKLVPDGVSQPEIVC